MGGAILETAVLMEIVKTQVNRGEEPRIWFWRTSTGVEVDFLVETGGRLIPAEVKLSSTPLPTMAPPSARCGRIWAAAPARVLWFTAAMCGCPLGPR
jgi:hypothetical protein